METKKVELTLQFMRLNQSPNEDYVNLKQAKLYSIPLGSGFITN